MSNTVLAGQIGLNQDTPTPKTLDNITQPTTHKDNVPEHIRNLYLDFDNNNRGTLGTVSGTGITHYPRPSNRSSVLNTITGRRNNTDAEFQLALIVFGEELAVHLFGDRKNSSYIRNMFSDLKYAVKTLTQHAESAIPGDELGWYNPTNKHYGGLRVDSLGKAQSGFPCKMFSLVINTGKDVIRDVSVGCIIQGRWFFNYRN